MICYIVTVTVLMQLGTVTSDESIEDYYNSRLQYGSYRGEMFPREYLSPEKRARPTAADVSHYVHTLLRVVDHFAQAPNDTDPNVAIGTFLMKGVLKRTLKDYGDKIGNEQSNIIKDIIHKAEDLISHYVYMNRLYGAADLGFKLSRLLVHDEPLVHSIGEFSTAGMTRWLLSHVRLHDHSQRMDDGSLPREEYAELVTDMAHYYKISDSDRCISSISTQPLPPSPARPPQPCRPDHYCADRVLQLPTVAYALSHQYLYLMGLALARRCYAGSELVHRTHMELLCAGMYREAVYLARRGYFYRDMFLEHVALCGLLGYEQFHRSNWFRKSASWIDEGGCMVENRNFEINRTRLYIARTKDPKEAKKIKRILALQLEEECQHHQMALVACVLAHAVRHGAHHLDPTA